MSPTERDHPNMTNEKPNQPGVYWGRLITKTFDGGRVTTLPFRVTVVGVGGVLLVQTGGDNPVYRTLDCYDWGEPLKSELEHIRQLAAQPKQMFG